MTNMIIPYMSVLIKHLGYHMDSRIVLTYLNLVRKNLSESDVGEFAA